MDYQQALQYQAMSKFGEDDRRTAEVYFKRVMALQFLDRPEEALKEVEQAEKVLKIKLSNLSAQNDEANAVEMEDVAAILEDLNDKRTELKSQLEEKEAMAQAVRGALSQFKNVAQETSAFSDSKADAGEELGSNKSNVASPVKDLGVVGRGTKRINLAPTTKPCADKDFQDNKNNASTTEKKPRTLEDLMGSQGGIGESSIGFGDNALPDSTK